MSRDDVHVFPVGDLIDHDTDGRENTEAPA